MIKSDDYLEPLKYYEHYLKDAHNDNVNNFFTELTNKSGIDIGENASTVKQINFNQSILDRLNKKLGGTTFLIVLMFILGIGGLLVGIFLLISGINDSKPSFIGIGVGLIVIGIIAFIAYFSYFRKKKSNLQGEINKISDKVNELKTTAYQQIHPLINLFNNDIPLRLMEKTAPLIDFSDYFSDDDEERIIHQFKDKLDKDPTHSTLCIQSGNINNNPFILRQVYEMEMHPYTYTGTLVISYQRVVSDGEGGQRTITVTQTLHASVTRPKPYYGVSTYLDFYNEAAPKLTFSRTPAGMEGKSDKEMNKIADKKNKEEHRKAEKALKEGKTYTVFANSKFESYMNISSRNNEVEYRLLFTPLAQNNFMYHFSKFDDVGFFKSGMKNRIISTRDVGMDYSGDISNYYHYDYEVIKKNFIDYNNKFFQNLYYDFLPILNIPLYHQNRSSDYISNKKKTHQISFYEAEVLINKFEPDLFKDSDCDTEMILKPIIGPDFIKVEGHSFKAIPRTDFIPTLGGDGDMHPVPVHYYEYEPVLTLTDIQYQIKKDNNYNEEGSINYRQFTAKI